MPYAHIHVTPDDPTPGNPRRRIPVPRRSHLRAAKAAADHLAKTGRALIKIWPTLRTIYRGKANRRHYVEPAMRKEGEE